MVCSPYQGQRHKHLGRQEWLHMPAAKYVYVDARLALLTLLLFGCTQTLYKSYGFAWLCVSLETVARSCHNVPYQEIMVFIHDAHLGSEQTHSIGMSYVCTEPWVEIPSV